MSQDTRSHDQAEEKTQYLRNLLQPEGFHAQKARDAAQSIGMLEISLGPEEVQIIRSFCRDFNPKRLIEIGTLTGYTALCFADLMSPESKLWTFELEPKHAALARECMAGHPREKQIFIVEGDAEKTLATVESEGPFDFMFIDGNKTAYPRYLDWAEKNLCKGALIVADNVFLGGRVYDTNDQRSQTQAMREFNKRLSDPAKYLSSLVPTPQGLFIAQKRF